MIHAAAALENYLAARINPERSRQFATQRWQDRLQRIEQMAAHSDLNSSALRISVVGSNGKGSTAWFLAAAMGGAGQVGLYSSPHLLDVGERIRVDLRPLESDALWSAIAALRAIFDDFDDCSYFEALSLAAMVCFRRRRCAVEVFEAGLGGRLDATRAAKAAIVVLTAIELEHTALLGNDHLSILREKLAIAGKHCSDLFLSEQRHIDTDRLLSTAGEFAPQARVHLHPIDGRPQNYLAANRGFAEFVARRLGRKVELNKATALPPGRMEERSLASGSRHCRVFFDVAHNPAAVERTLSDLIRERNLKATETIVILLVLADRNLPELCKPLDAHGFRRRYALQGEGLAHAEEAALPLAEPRWLEELGKSWMQTPPQTALFLGSHRLYKYFLEFVQRFEDIAKEEPLRQ